MSGMPVIQFDVPLFTTEAGRKASEAILIPLLEALIRTDMILLREAPSLYPPLYQSGVRYRGEDGTEVWKTIPACLRDGYGDCEDLASWRNAEYRVKGVDAKPALSWRNIDGRYVYHALCALPGGTIEDPSRMLGMGGDPGKLTPYPADNRYPRGVVLPRRKASA